MASAIPIDELHDQVEICPEGGARTQKAFIGEKDSTSNYSPQISSSQ